MNNFNIVNVDTDAITVAKPNREPFTDEEIEKLTKSLNSFFPPEINWEFEEKYKRIIVLKAKNYILYNGDRIVLKGSALKSATLEPKMKEMLKEFIDALVFDKQNLLPEIYMKYVKEVDCITDIKPWAKKMTLSATTYASTRKNETNVIDAIRDTEYVEGDKIFVYFRNDGSLRLAEKFDRDYDKARFYEKIYKTAGRFSTIIDTENLFKNYKLKKNIKELEPILTK